MSILKESYLLFQFAEEHCIKLDQLRDYFREEQALFHNYLPDKTASERTAHDEDLNLNQRNGNDS